MTDLTVFVATFNRTDTLRRCLAALSRQQKPHRVAIVDNGSKDQAAISLLDELSGEHAVYRMPPIEEVPPEPGDDDAHGGQAMQAVQRNLSRAFAVEWETQPRPRWFAVTDADVSVDGREDSLDAYIRLAEATDRAVGPHLRLNPDDNYPLRNRVLSEQARILFRDYMFWHGDIPWSPDPIDTTFHLFPASPSFNRLGMSTARVGPPWDATHTDWQVDVLNPSAENLAYILGSGEAASWGGRWIRGMFEAFRRDPEEAFSLVEADTPTHENYFNPYFMLSWMLQYGHGCDIDLERSRAMLRAAFPSWSPCWEYERYWDQLVYDGDHSCLGW